MRWMAVGFRAILRGRDPRRESVVHLGVEVATATAAMIAAAISIVGLISSACYFANSEYRYVKEIAVLKRLMNITKILFLNASFLVKKEGQKIDQK